jgi:hypothetical protein
MAGVSEKQEKLNSHRIKLLRQSKPQGQGGKGISFLAYKIGGVAIGITE